MNGATISLRAFFVGQGDNHYRWESQLLLPHHAVFMKHLASGLQVNISFTDKAKPCTLKKKTVLTTTYGAQLPHCHYPISPTLLFMVLINGDPFHGMLNRFLGVVY